MVTFREQFYELSALDKVLEAVNRHLPFDENNGL